MEPLRALMETGLAWLSGPVLPLLALLVGYLAARLTQAGTARNQIKAERTHWQGRLLDLEEHAQLLGQENLRLEEALQERRKEAELLAARMGDAAARDRQELVRLQEELESDHRIGLEKARLIRSSEAALQRALADFRQTRFYRERQRVSLSALQAALTHSKRAQASTQGRLATLRDQLRQQAFQTAQETAVTERVVERIIEIPVETIVYRDREVPVEVPIEVPVGFTTFAAPPLARGLRPRYSENRPSSA